MAQKLTIAIGGDPSGYEKALSTVQKGTRKAGEVLKQTAKAAAIGFTALSGAAAFAINEARKIETVTTQFEVLTGSATKAADVVKDLQNFAATTPFQFEGIAKAGQQLLGFGFQAEEVKDRLQEIGDVAAASGRPIDEISQIFGQVSAAGKLTGERLLQFQERAIPIGPALAKTMGVAESAVKDLVSTGAVDFETFQQAFQSLSEEGGVAFGGMVKQSKTLSGVISTLKDNVSLFAADVGKEMLPIAKLLAERFISLVQEIRSSSTAMDNFRAVIAGTVKIATFVKTSFENLGTVIGAGLATAIEAATAAINLNFSKAKEIIKTNAIEVAETLKENNKELNQDLNAIDESFRAQKEQRNAEELERIKRREEEKRNILANARTEQEEEEIAAREEEQAKQEERRLIELEKLQEHQNKLEKIEKSRILSVEEAKREVAREDLKAQVKENNQRLKEEVKYGKNLAKAMAFFRDERVGATRQMFSNLETLSESSNKKLAAIGKAAALASAFVDTAAAVTKALASAPPPFNLALAASIGAAGAVQIAKIQGVKFQDGGVFEGGIPGVDSIPAVVQRREIIAPVRSFDEVVEGTARQRGFVKRGEVSSVQQSPDILPVLTEIRDALSRGSSVQIGFAGDAFEIIEEKLLERRALGIGTL